MAKGASPAGQARPGAVPGAGLGFSLLADTAGWAARSSGLCLHCNHTSEQQERRQPLTHTIHWLADLRYRSSLFLVLWEQELTCVPWSPDIHATLGRRGRSITAPCSACVTLWEQPLSSMLYFQAPALTVARSLSGGLPALPGGRERIMKAAKRWEVAASSALPWSSPPSLIYLVLT